MIGQTKIREDLTIQIKSSVKSNAVIEPIFLGGAYGLGKTTMGFWIAQQIKTHSKQSIDFICRSGNELSTIDDLYKMVADEYAYETANYKIRMVDEAHTVPDRLVSSLNYYITANLEGTQLRATVHKPCVFIFATEFEGQMQPSLRSRFVHSYRLTPYSTQDLIAIMKRHLPELKRKYDINVKIDSIALRYIAERSRRNARCAVNYFTKCLKEADKRLSVSVVKKCFERNNIGDKGTTLLDMVLLYHLYAQTTEIQGGKPLSLSRIADQLSINKNEISQICEPFLNTEGWLDINSKGRTLTPLGIRFVREREQYLKNIYNQYRRGEL